jgi:copper chaperone NosL
MAISEKPFAAQAIGRDGEVFKFDDIGCMVKFIRETGFKHRAAAFFVVDYDNKDWLEAGQARFVQSAGIRSPMASGIIALRDDARAAGYAARYDGRRLTFEDLTKQ